MSATQGIKTEQIELIRDRFSRATSAVLVDFKKLNVKLDMQLRVALKQAGCEYRVVKNTLVKLAIKGTPLDTDAFKKALAGNTGIAWSYEDPSAAAKVFKAFRSDEARAQKLLLKCGVIDNVVMAGARVETELATMPGKNEVRAMLLAQLNAPAQSLVRQLSAPGQNLAYALDARKRQLETQG